MGVASSDSSVERRPIPITVLSGFLGAGKTTFLQRAVTNKDGTKYGLIVNDMAAINVDSKMIKQKTTGFEDVDTMELENGCVCCSLAEDMLASVSRLVSLSSLKQEPYDHIVVECSGISEPRNIRELFQEAADMNMPNIDKIRLDTLVTIVDARVFLDLFGSNEDVASNPRLAFHSDQLTIEEQSQTTRKITELLLEQVECSDVVVINKVDLCKDEAELALCEKVVRTINPFASVHTCTRGEIEVGKVLGVARGQGAADWGVLDEHRKLVNTVDSANGSEPGCTDASHDHDHSHSHGNDAACSEPGCTDASHDHDHSHSHSHSHTNSEQTTAEVRFGITSFVYKRRRPFHPARLTTFLQGLGTLSVEGLGDIAVKASDKKVGGSKTAITSASKSILRSKGFVWMATSKAGAYFISHAGQFLELVMLGRWWGDIPRDEWPDGLEPEIMVDFDRSGSTHGDRRQEIVFIGNFEDPSIREGLESVLDTCLLTDDEMKLYEKTAQNGDDALRALYFPPKSSE
jgi:G3E family GTPase